MNQPNRPSKHELHQKLREAKNLLDQGFGLFAELGKAVGELNALGLGDSKAVWPLISKLLTEISTDHYSGSRPPAKSYEKSIEGRDLFAFSWDSQHLGKRMYLKFALKGDRFYYVSLHVDRPPQRAKKGDPREMFKL